MENEIDDIDSLKKYLNEIDGLEDEELNDEIIELKNDIKEMIKLKNDEILEKRRSEVLLKFDAVVPKEVFSEVFKPIGSLIGINFIYNNGSYGTRNAVIIDQLYKNNTISYKVIYSNPIYPNEIPCKTIVSKGVCNNDLCRYNHGIEVNHDKILSSLDCPLIEGNVCLVQLNDDDLWTRGKILHIDPIQDTFVVELIDRAGSHLDHTYNVNRQRIVGHKDSSIDISDNISEDDNDIEITEIFSATHLPTDKFGNWEAHTRGIGLKLLLKMGYQIGEGLGVKNQGRVSPVKVTANHIKKKRLHKVKQVEKKLSLSTVDHETISGIKTAIIRNHDKISSIKDNIEQLEKLKKRNNCDKSVMKVAEDRITKLKLKVTDLEGEEKSLMKKQSKKYPKKKLNIF